MLSIYSGDLVFFYFPCRLHPCMSLLGSSLLSRFSGIVNCRLVFFALCLKATYEWVNRYLYRVKRYLSFWIWVTSLNMMFSSSIYLAANLKMSLFFLLCSTPLCKCTTFSLFILQSKGILVVTRFWLWQTVFLWIYLNTCPLWHDWASFRYIQKSGTSGSWGRLFSNSLSNHHTGIKWGCTNLHSH